MNIVTLIFRELFGMFVDDEFLAIAVLGVVLAAWLVSPTFGVAPMFTGTVLLFGCVAVLLYSVFKASWRKV
ncbi:hypothetical protein BH10PSE7_BH10PSE7_37980 [soil metagenome]